MNIIKIRIVDIKQINVPLDCIIQIIKEKKLKVINNINLALKFFEIRKNIKKTILKIAIIRDIPVILG